MKVTNYGGTIMSVEMPDADGNRADVVLGFETPEEYFGDHPFLAQQSGGMPTGSQTAGSRWAERITPSRATKNGVNLLHGGDNSFNRKVWDGTADGNMLTLSYHSPDGEGGFPGAVDAH